MKTGFLGDLVVVFRTFEHLLHQVDAAARTVALIAKQLVRRAGGIAEAAVNAASQDSVGLANVRLLEVFFAEMGLHVVIR